MMILPNPTHITTVASMGDYHIFTFGDEDSGVIVTTVFRNGECRDSYVCVGPFGGKHSYLNLEFVK